MNTNSKGPMNNELATIDDLQIIPLSDEELNSVAGGATDTTTAASCECCVAGATNLRIPIKIVPTE